MKNFTLQLIDFSSIEAANDVIPTFDRKVKNKKLLYQIAFNIELVRYSENFEAWYGQLLLINKELMIKHITLENCIELGKLLTGSCNLAKIARPINIVPILNCEFSAW